MNLLYSTYLITLNIIQHLNKKSVNKIIDIVTYNEKDYVKSIKLLNYSLHSYEPNNVIFNIIKYKNNNIDQSNVNKIINYSALLNNKKIFRITFNKFNNEDTLNFIINNDILESNLIKSNYEISKFLLKKISR